MALSLATRLELDEREAALLLEVCRDALKEREEVLRSLLARLPG